MAYAQEYVTIKINRTMSVKFYKLQDVSYDIAFHIWTGKNWGKDNIQ